MSESSKHTPISQKSTLRRSTHFYRDELFHIYVYMQHTYYMRSRYIEIPKRGPLPNLYIANVCDPWLDLCQTQGQFINDLWKVYSERRSQHLFYSIFLRTMWPISALIVERRLLLCRTNKDIRACYRVNNGALLWSRSSSHNDDLQEASSCKESASSRNWKRNVSRKLCTLFITGYLSCLRDSDCQKIAC